MDVPARSLGAYAPAAGQEAVEAARAAALPLRGMRVLHVSVAGDGGPVPELMQSLLPLVADAGLDVEWRVMFGPPELHRVAAALADGLQGAETDVSDSDWSAYMEACASALGSLDGEYDAVMLHDPGALGAAPAAPGPAVWRCHLDASAPDPPAWKRVRDLASRCAARAFADGSFVPDGLDGVHVTAPGIDPLSPRNLDLAPRLAGRVQRQLGLDTRRPLVFQAMRFDRWKDPHLTTEAFALAKAERPELQLVLAGALDSGDGDGWRAVKEITDYAAGEDDLHVLTSYSGLGNLELGALQQMARVALRLSLREGFGLAASEAMWKGTPVVGGGGGVPLQVRDGVDGYLTSTAEDAAGRMVELLADPGLAIEMGDAARERVRERFLITRALADELALLAAVGAGPGDTLEPR